MNSKLDANNFSCDDCASNNKLNNWIYETQLEQWYEILNYWYSDFSIKDKTFFSLSNFVRWETIANNLEAKHWSWHLISSNPDVTWDIICNNSNKPLCSCWSNKPECDILSHSSCRTQCNCPKGTIPWNWYGISRNSNITWDVIQANPDKPWNWTHISTNPNITFDIVANNLHCDWQISLLKCYDQITWDLIRNNLDKRWDWCAISRNLNITWDIVINNLVYPPKPDNCVGDYPVGIIPWDWNCISQHPNITINIIKNNLVYPPKPDNCVDDYPDGPIPWNWWGISFNKNIFWHDIQANPDMPWNWYGISQNPNITWDDIVNNPDKPWNWHYISQNPNITWDIIISNLEYPWNWYSLTKKKDLTWDIIKMYPNEKWDWTHIFKTIDLSDKAIRDDFMDMIFDEGNYNNLPIACVPWHWHNILSNPTITWNDVRSIKMKCGSPQYISIVNNDFPYQLDLIKQDCIIKWNAANRIRKWWLFDVYFNPFTRVGAKRLEKSYLEMLGDDS